MAALPKTFPNLQQFVCDRLAAVWGESEGCGEESEGTVAVRHGNSGRFKRLWAVMQLYENEEGFMVLMRAVRAVRVTVFMFLRAVWIKVGGVDSFTKRGPKGVKTETEASAKVRPKSRELPIWRAQIYGQSSPSPMNHGTCGTWPWDVEPCMCETSLTCSRSSLARKQLVRASK
jgi:hypothetical protein